MASAPIHVVRTRRGSHLVWTGYGHWLPNDPRGSGSTVVRSEALDAIGPVHQGRRPAQPSREVVKTFYRNAEPKLLHPVIWFDERDRHRIGQSFCDAADANGYTVWALSVMRNHVHEVIRSHRDRPEAMLLRLTTAMREALWDSSKVPRHHPVWSGRMYKVYLNSDDAVLRTIRYVEQNPIKEGLPPQRWPCVRAFSG